MAKATQAFKETEVRRAVRALRDAGVVISRVTFERGKFEFHTADSQAESPKETAAERWLREQAEAKS
jgi:hypothetical protein